MLDKVTHDTPAPPEPDCARALRALVWAADIGTQNPEALHTPPELPSAEELRSLRLETLRLHLDRMLLGRHTQEGLDALHRCGVLEVWLPEVFALVGFGDGEWRHKDVWKHTKQVVWQSVPRIEVRWGALLHDIGKVKTRKIEPSGEVHFFGHSEVGAAMFRKRVGKRLGFSGELYERVHYLILYHLRASQYDGSWTDSAVRRFSREMGDGLTDLLDLSRADITTKRPERRKKGLRQISELSGRIEKLVADDARLPPLSKGIGNSIMEHFGLPPSRRVGELKRLLETEIEQGTLEARRDDQYYLEWLESQRTTLGI
ncbi:MAG TPA: HDIG domain-containing protein [Polyangiales bacterium]|nr:HDIG domain-containing protein [Polyangiales bacterium]